MHRKARKFKKQHRTMWQCRRESRHSFLHHDFVPFHSIGNVTMQHGLVQCHRECAFQSRKKLLVYFPARKS